jgi:hypothetical protein
MSKWNAMELPNPVTRETYSGTNGAKKIKLKMKRN